MAIRHAAPVDPLESPFLDPDYVSEVTSMPDPVERNRWITRGYHELAAAVGEIIGRENANWLCFGQWASAEAGRAIRKESIPAIARPFFGGAVSDAVGRGNACVFEDVSQPFSRFVLAFAGHRVGLPVPSEGQARATLAALCEHPQLAVSPDLCRAFSAYTDALLLRDTLGNVAATMRAQRILVGNISIGAHEQIVAEPFVRDAIPGGSVLAIMATAQMALRLPQGMLDLDEDVPAPNYLDGACFPACLAELTDPEALELCSRFGQDPGSTLHSDAPNWESYDERMGYIFTMERAFQQDPLIFEMPRDHRLS
jgi:hypothetical protein